MDPTRRPALHHLQTRPPTQLLDRPEIDARHGEPTGEGVTQRVRRHPLELGAPTGPPEGRADRPKALPSRRTKTCGCSPPSS